MCKMDPHLLSEDQKKERIRICKQWLSEFEPNGPKRFSDVVTGDECWISFFTTRDKQSNMVWLGEDEPRPQILKTGFRSRKRLFTVFFNSQGPVCLDIMPQDTTITARYYTEHVLPQVLHHCQQTSPTRTGPRILLHHDNAAPHKAKLTTSYIEDQRLSLLPHPPYSPDLAPCDFWLFPKIKSGIAGKPFSRIQDLAKAVNSELRSIPQSEYHNCFQSWRKRMERCVDVGGEYFEGMKWKNLLFHCLYKNYTSTVITFWSPLVLNQPASKKEKFQMERRVPEASPLLVQLFQERKGKISAKHMNRHKMAADFRISLYRLCVIWDVFAYWLRTRTRTSYMS